MDPIPTWAVGREAQFVPWCWLGASQGLILRPQGHHTDERRVQGWTSFTWVATQSSDKAAPATAAAFHNEAKDPFSEFRTDFVATKLATFNPKSRHYSKGQ